MDRFLIEAEALRRRYDRRRDGVRYSRDRPEVRLMTDERRRATQLCLSERGWTDLSARRVTEVGCGEGNVIAELLRLGFGAEGVTGIDLLAQALAAARHKLPAEVRLLHGDARAMPIAAESQDLVVCFTVFSSVLDDAFRAVLADTMWRWLKPGGAVLCYDFVVDNPFNRDVKGVPLKQIRALFPQALVSARSVTLAPPLARAACRLHPSLYHLLNTCPPLRTHLLTWIEKPRAP